MEPQALGEMAHPILSSFSQAHRVFLQWMRDLNELEVGSFSHLEGTLSSWIPGFLVAP